MKRLLIAFITAFTYFTMIYPMLALTTWPIIILAHFSFPNHITMLIVAIPSLLIGGGIIGGSVMLLTSSFTIGILKLFAASSQPRDYAPLAFGNLTLIITHICFAMRYIPNTFSSETAVFISSAICFIYHLAAIAYISYACRKRDPTAFKKYLSPDEITPSDRYANADSASRTIIMSTTTND